MFDRFLEARPSSAYRHGPLLRFGTRELDLSGLLAASIPRLGAHVLHHGSAVGPSWAFDRRGRLVTSASWHGSEDPGPGEVVAEHRLRGTAITLGTTYGTHWGHAIPDAIGRIGLVPEREIRRARHILVPGLHKAPQARLLLDRLGLRERAIEMEWGHRYTADRLLVPTFPGLRRQYDRVVTETLRSALPIAEGARKLFVTRRGFVRNPVQADEIEAIAVSLGFEIYDPMTADDQALDFRSAVAVAGVSGSGLTGIGFLRPGARVVELHSDAHLFPYYVSLAAAADVEYGYTIGASLGDRPIAGASKDDIDFDLDAVAAALRWAAAVPVDRESTPVQRPDA